MSQNVIAKWSPAFSLISRKARVTLTDFNLSVNRPNEAVTSHWRVGHWRAWSSIPTEVGLLQQTAGWQRFFTVCLLIQFRTGCQIDNAATNALTNALVKKSRLKVISCWQQSPNQITSKVSSFEISLTALEKLNLYLCWIDNTTLTSLVSSLLLLKVSSAAQPV